MGHEVGDISIARQIYEHDDEQLTNALHLMIVVSEQCPIGLRVQLKTAAAENTGDSFKSQPRLLIGRVKPGVQCVKAGNRS